MARQTSINQWQEGMVLDKNPIAMSKTELAGALNATTITMNGNEFILQNDMGNGRVESAYLPAGFVPVGMKEFGGIVYVASHNPLTKQSQIGCFPSPERNVSSDENGSSVKKLENFTQSYKSEQKYESASTDIEFGSDNIVYSKYVGNDDSSVVKEYSYIREATIDSLTQKIMLADTIRPGDKFSIHIPDDNTEYVIDNLMIWLQRGSLKMDVAVIDASGNLTNIALNALASQYWYNITELSGDNKITYKKNWINTPPNVNTCTYDFYSWCQCDYVDSNNKTHSDIYYQSFINMKDVTDTKDIIWNIYKNKIVGDLYLIFTLNTPDILSSFIEGVTEPTFVNVQGVDLPSECSMGINLLTYYTLNLYNQPIIFTDDCLVYEIKDASSKPYQDIYLYEDCSVGTEREIGKEALMSQVEGQITGKQANTEYYWLVNPVNTASAYFIRYSFIKKYANIAINTYKIKVSPAEQGNNYESIELVSDEDITIDSDDKETYDSYEKVFNFKIEWPDGEKNEETIASLSDAKAYLNYEITPYYRISDTTHENFNNGWLSQLTTTGSFNLAWLNSGKILFQSIQYYIEDATDYGQLLLKYQLQTYLKNKQSISNVTLHCVDYYGWNQICSKYSAAEKNPSSCENISKYLSGDYAKYHITKTLTPRNNYNSSFVDGIYLQPKETENYGTTLSLDSIYYAWISVDKITSNNSIVTTSNSDVFVIITVPDGNSLYNSTDTFIRDGDTKEGDITTDSKTLVFTPKVNSVLQTKCESMDIPDIDDITKGTAEYTATKTYNAEFTFTFDENILNLFTIKNSEVKFSIPSGGIKTDDPDNLITWNKVSDLKFTKIVSYKYSITNNGEIDYITNDTGNEYISLISSDRSYHVLPQQTNTDKMYACFFDSGGGRESENHTKTIFAVENINGEYELLKDRLQKSSYSKAGSDRPKNTFPYLIPETCLTTSNLLKTAPKLPMLAFLGHMKVCDLNIDDWILYGSYCVSVLAVHTQNGYSPTNIIFPSLYQEKSAFNGSEYAYGSGNMNTGVKKDEIPPYSKYIGSSDDSRITTFLTELKNNHTLTSNVNSIQQTSKNINIAIEDVTKSHTVINTITVNYDINKCFYYKGLSANTFDTYKISFACNKESVVTIEEPYSQLDISENYSDVMLDKNTVISRSGYFVASSDSDELLFNVGEPTLKNNCIYTGAKSNTFVDTLLSKADFRWVDENTEYVPVYMNGTTKAISDIGPTQTVLPWKQLSQANNYITETYTGFDSRDKTVAAGKNEIFCRDYWFTGNWLIEDYDSNTNRGFQCLFTFSSDMSNGNRYEAGIGPAGSNFYII